MESVWSVPINLILKRIMTFQTEGAHALSWTKIYFDSMESKMVIPHTLL